MHADDRDPYAAPQAALVDVPDVQVLADRGMRLAGAFIDGMLIAMLLLPLMYFGGYFEGILHGQKPGFAQQAMWAGIGFGLFLVVQGVPLARSGQTWGKKMLKMRIVDLDGHKPAFGRLIALRYLTTRVIGVVPLVGPLFALVDALCIFGDERRCLHDRFAGTRVVVAD